MLTRPLSEVCALPLIILTLVLRRGVWYINAFFLSTKACDCICAVYCVKTKIFDVSFDVAGTVLIHKFFLR